MTVPASYDAVLLVSFGGPEGLDDVLPFLRNVTRGRDVPDERLAEVAGHYRRFGGVSPINEQCRALLAALGTEFGRQGIELPLYWGNRNWHPYLADTVRAMRDAGVRRALAFVTSAYGSYSACRQYLGDIESARTEVGPGAPVIDKIRHFHDHPGFVEPHADAVRTALAQLPAERRDSARLVFTAHSIPVSMAATAGPYPGGGRYQAQLREAAALVAQRVGCTGWDLVWQSRSGPARVPWLEPDINDHLAALAGVGALSDRAAGGAAAGAGAGGNGLVGAGVTGVVVSPIGFVSDHLEVVWDLDTEAAATARGLGLDFVRAATPGTDPRFVSMVAELVSERIAGAAPRVLGAVPSWDFCAADCCARPPRRPAARTSD